MKNGATTALTIQSLVRRPAGVQLASSHMRHAGSCRKTNRIIQVCTSPSWSSSGLKTRDSGHKGEGLTRDRPDWRGTRRGPGEIAFSPQAGLRATSLQKEDAEFLVTLDGPRPPDSVACSMSSGMSRATCRRCVPPGAPGSASPACSARRGSAAEMSRALGNVLSQSSSLLLSAE